MLKPSFFNRQRTAVTALFKGKSVEELIATARTAEFEGADGIAMDLGDLAPELRTEENFRRMMEAVRLPFMFLSYRSDRWFGADDQARQRFLLTAADAGAEVIDVMGDLFDPAPFELTMNPAAVEKQKKLIDDLHARGAKVIMSSHMPQARKCDEVLAHLREQSSRGADILKIVTAINSEEEFLDAVRTTMTLNRESDKPFVHLCNGSFSRMHRFLGPRLGVAITFGIVRYDPNSPQTQPTIKAFRAVEENLHWHLNDR